MLHLALKMLMGDRGKYLGIVMGLTFASLIMTQQPAIFVGLIMRSYSFITDLGLPDIWVMDPEVQWVDDIKPLQDTKLFQVRGVEGVEWAVPLYKGQLRARLSNGMFQTCNVIGLDDASLVAGPPTMVQGSLADLRRADGVIVDEAAANGKLAKPGPTSDARVRCALSKAIDRQCSRLRPAARAIRVMVFTAGPPPGRRGGRRGRRR